MQHQLSLRLQDELEGMDSVVSEQRFTFEEFKAIIDGIIAWGETLRLYYNREECECCGAAYHPLDGDPPDEDDCDRGKEHCYCGHAGMREMHACWDRKKNDWSEFYSW